KFEGTTPVRSCWQFQQTSNLLTTASLQLRQVQKVVDMQLLFLVQILAVRFLDAKLFQTVLQRAESETEELRGLGDVIVSLLHRLRDQITFDIFEVDSFC